MRTERDVWRRFFPVYILVIVISWMASTGAFAQSDDDYYYSELIFEHQTEVILSLDNGHSVGYERSVDFQATAFSADEKHFYAWAPRDSELYIYNRDAETGHLEFSEVQTDSLLYTWQSNNIILSPDGQHVYLSYYYQDNQGYANSRILIAERNSDTGHITIQDNFEPQVEFSTTLGLGGLRCFSEDGQFVYGIYHTPGQSSHLDYYEYMLIVMQRDLSTGQLTVIQTLASHNNLATPLANVTDFTISPNGQYVLITTSSQNPLHVFERSMTTGILTTVKSYIDIELENLSNLTSMVFAEDANHLYFSDSDGWLMQCVWNPSTGQVTPMGLVPGNMSQLSMHPTGRELYGIDNSNFHLYTRNPETGNLTYRYATRQIAMPVKYGEYQTHTLNPEVMYVGSKGEQFYFKDRFSSIISMCKRHAGNTPPTAALTVQTHKGMLDTLFQFDATAVTDFHDSTHTLQVRWDWEGDGQWDTEYSTDQDTVHQFDVPGAYSPTMEVRDRDGLLDTASATITVFTPEQISAGRLTATTDLVHNTEALIGIEKVVCSPDGRFVYTLSSRLGATLCIYTRDTETGALIQMSVLREIPGLSQIPQHIEFSPDGRFMALLVGSDIAIVARDSLTGQLSPAVIVNKSLSEAFQEHMKFSPDNRWLYTVNSFNQLVGLQRVGENWSTVTEEILQGNINIFDFNADGTRLYTPYQIFERDTLTGQLTKIMDLQGANSIGDGGISSFCVSADGRFMYGLSINAFSQLWGVRIDEEAGVMTGVDMIVKHDTPMENSLNEFLRPGAMNMSPDGRNLYVTQSDRTYGIITFARDTVNGYLMLSESLWDEDLPVPTMDGANSLVVAPDGRHVYVASENAHTLSVFRRNIPTSIGEQTMTLFGPKEYRLQQNYPNPFNPVTTIRYELPQDAHVRLTIYDLLGREVTTLVNQAQSAGVYNLPWHGLNCYGAPVASGIYIYRLEAGRDFVQSRKMLLLK
jgi:6-phosphogluconolactonase (cycloisomerase 2 family)